MHASAGRGCCQAGSRRTHLPLSPADSGHCESCWYCAMACSHIVQLLESGHSCSSVFVLMSKARRIWDVTRLLRNICSTVRCKEREKSQRPSFHYCHASDDCRGLVCLANCQHFLSASSPELRKPRNQRAVHVSLPGVSSLSLFMSLFLWLSVTHIHTRPPFCPSPLHALSLSQCIIIIIVIVRLTCMGRVQSSIAPLLAVLNEWVFHAVVGRSLADTGIHVDAGKLQTTTSSYWHEAFVLSQPENGTVWKQVTSSLCGRLMFCAHVGANDAGPNNGAGDWTQHPPAPALCSGTFFACERGHRPPADSESDR